MFRLACYGKKLSLVLLSPVFSLVLESGSLLSYMNTCVSTEEVTAEVRASDRGQEEDGAVLVAMLV